ncbi:unnamed protein product [Somion occarium]|uniref:PhoD-like phosphatase metallophosphatase domain-containing protein n=1 Tax=Somion occarium TaxID=3059160 RepID=A0ABP1D9S5_9APHY
MASTGLTSLSLTSLSSTLFRIAAYIFLRVIPARIFKTLLPSLYVLYITSVYLDSASIESEITAEIKSATEDEKELPPIPNRSHVTEVKSHPSIWESLVFLVSSSRSDSSRIRKANLAINTLLLLAAAEFVVYPVLDKATDVTFTRVGAVYPDSVKIVVRYPHHDTNETQVQVVWRQASDSQVIPGWKTGPIVNLTEHNDWVNTVRLTGLWPSTSYEYRLQDSNETLLPYPTEPIQFRTFPDPRISVGSHFRFLATSCATPNFPYAPLRGRRIKGFDLLADYLWPRSTTVPSIPPAASRASNDSIGDIIKSAVNETVSAASSAFSNLTKPAAQSERDIPPAEFMLFLGDFIYADVPMYYGDDKEAYRRLYRRNYQSPSFRKVYERLPMIHTYDDHEIINNYAGQGNDSKPPFPNATDAFQLYNSDANYDPHADKDAYYYDFRYGDVAYFVMDTRRYRSTFSDGTVATRTMLGEKQLAALYDWLGRVNATSTFKFIVSSVPFTSLWTHDAQVDSWAAYESEKAALLNALHSVPNVIILSGDRHEFATIEFNADGPGHKVIEVSTSPLSMFYIPFVRTLRPASESTVKSVRIVDNQEIVEEVPEERVIKYIGPGNYKWSSFEVDTRDLNHPTVHLEVMIDGSSAYRLEIAGKPVQLHTSTALGAFVPEGFKGLLSKIGLSPTRWF